MRKEIVIARGEIMINDRTEADDRTEAEGRIAHVNQKLEQLELRARLTETTPYWQ